MPQETRKKFTKRFYLSGAAGFSLGALFTVLYALTLEPELMASALNFILALTAAVVVFAACPMDFFLARKRGQFLENFYGNRLSEAEVEKGFFKLIRLPVLQSLLLFLRIGIGLIIILVYLYLYLNASFINILSISIFSFFGIYVAAIVSYLVIFSIIERPLKDIISRGYIRPGAIKDRKYFGISYRSRTLIFLFIPVLVGYLNICLLSMLTLPESSFLMFRSRLIQILVINLTCFLLGFFVFFRHEKRIITNLTASVDTLADSKADLTHKISCTLEDEFGYISFRINTLFNNLRQLITKLKNFTEQSKNLAGNLKSNSTQVYDAIEEIATAMSAFQEQTETFNIELAQSDSTVTEIKEYIARVNKGIEEQAAAVAESSASVEETLASLNNMSQIAEEKKGLINNLTRLAQVGESNMNDMMVSIEGISRSAGTIIEMMDIINGVAKETSLLAMNAAIEAAHAGEYGKGFAVVADEIQKLSEATGSNAKSISTSLTGIMENIKKTSLVSEDTGNSISQIIEGIAEVANSMSELLSGMQEISSGSSEVMISLTNMVQLTEDVRQSSREMDKRADEIEQSVNHVSRFSEKYSSNINEISTSLHKIKGSMELLTGLGSKNSENLDLFEKMISGFQIKGEAEGTVPEDEPPLLVEKVESC